MESKQSKEICDIVSSAMSDFRQGMDHSHQLSIRIGRRTTQIIRFGLMSVLALAAAMFYLISTLGSDFARITEHMVAMSGYMQQMDQNLMDVSENLISIDHTLSSMQSDVSDMSTNLETMDQKVGGMNAAVHDMTISMRRMNGEMQDMSRPMGFFP